MKKLSKKPIRLLGSFLILIAPFIAGSFASVFLWGEPECPECLKQQK